MGKPCKCGCLACADRIDELERLAGLDEEVGRISKIKAAFGVKDQMPARLALIMYRRGDRYVNKSEIDVIFAPRHRTGERDGWRLLEVTVCNLRKAMGRDAVETFWGSGYRLTPAGRAAIAQALGE